MKPAQRIVSMAPSVTETLFALGLGDRVVGITRFCLYPPEAQDLPRVGGHLDPNLEAVVTLRPELIVALEEQQQSAAALAKLGLPVLAVRHKDVEGILASFTAIGRACGAEPQARRLATEIRARLDRIARQTAGLDRPRVLLAVDRPVGTGRLENVYVAGADGYFDTMIALAGGRSAYPAGNARFPVVSTEGILSIDPDVIVEMSVAGLADEAARRAHLAEWQQVGSVEAVRRGRVYLLEKDYAFIPGPRFVLLVEDLARLIHPELEWSKEGIGD